MRREDCPMTSSWDEYVAGDDLGVTAGESDVAYAGLDAASASAVTTDIADSVLADQPGDAGAVATDAPTDNATATDPATAADAGAAATGSAADAADAAAVGPEAVAAAVEVVLDGAAN